MSPPLVLVTGATGHIGFRTLVEVLKAGYRARVSTRKIVQSERILQAKSVQPYIDRIDFVEVPDVTKPGAFDDAIQNVELVLHLASPIPDPSLNGSVKDIYLNPAIQGTVSILESAAKAGTVKRVVLTSSVVILAPKEGSKVVSSDDLAPIPNTDEVADDPWIAYRASKILAYDAAQKWMAINTPSFDLLSILPAYVQGRNELVTRKEDVKNGSNDVMVDLALGNKTDKPRFSVVVWVDDVARLEVAALDLTKGKNGDRYIAAWPEKVMWDEFTPIIREAFPEAVKKGVLPLDGSQPSISLLYDVQNTTNTMGVTFAGAETMVKSLIGQYVELATAT